MSHFTVLVVGENPEQQLVPFQENNMGDCPKEFLEFIKDEDSDYDDEAKEHGYWDNPNAKWDWYQLGGRWTGYFKLKPGATGVAGKPGLMTGGAPSGFVDQAVKSSIDFDFMRKSRYDEGVKEYETIASFFQDAIIPKIERKWMDLLNDDSLDIDQKRYIYQTQPGNLKLKEIKQGMTYSSENPLFYFGFSLDNFQCTKEEYAQDCADNAGVSFALLKDGVWYERGKMGWWAVVQNEKDGNSWNSEFQKMFDEIPEDTLLSVYDCHI